VEVPAKGLKRDNPLEVIDDNRDDTKRARVDSAPPGQAVLQFHLESE
jgi:hypothetical protein